MPKRRKSMPGAGIEPALHRVERGFKGPASTETAPNPHTSDDLSPADATVGATSLTKRCARCGEDKALTEYNHRVRRGKRYAQPYCKPCFLAYWHEWYDKGGKKGFGEAKQRWREKYPERERAHQIVTYALKTGRLVRGECMMRAFGGCRGKIQAHHPDYSKPLEVLWLCVAHHNEADVDAGVGKRGRPRKSDEPTEGAA